MHYHSQNLNEKGRDVTGHKFWSGRSWLRVTKNICAHWEWHFGNHSRHLGSNIRVFGEDFDLSVHAGVPRVMSAWFDFRVCDREKIVNLFKGMRVHKRVRDAVYGHGQGLCLFGIGLYEWTLRLEGLLSDSFDSLTDRSVSINFKDLVLGDWKYRDTPIDVIDTEIPMPERTYPARITFNKCELVSERFPWPLATFVRSRVDILDGQSDICPKGLYSSCTDAKTVHKAVSRVVDHVLRQRRGH